LCDVSDEIAEPRWGPLAEYAIACAEYNIAHQLMLSRPRSSNGATELTSPEFIAKLKAAQKLLSARGRMARLEPKSLPDAPGASAH
jgi:hypothetical protein